MERLPNLALSNMAGFLGEPSDALTEAENGACFRVLQALKTVSRILRAWYQYWHDTDMDISFHDLSSHIDFCGRLVSISVRISGY